MAVCCCTLRFILKLNSASAAFTFGRGGILSENRKDGKVTVHSAKNTTKFDSTVGPYANSADQINLGVAAALRSNIYGGVPRATSLTTILSGGPDADDCAYVEFKVDGTQSALSNSFIGAFQVPSSWPTCPGETLAPGDAPPDFLDVFRPQHHCAVFNAGTPRYFMMHLLNGRLYGLDMDAHCHFPDCDCDTSVHFCACGVECRGEARPRAPADATEQTPPGISLQSKWLRILGATNLNFRK